MDLQLTSGSRLGGYEIVAPLGAGGMGEVYRARDLRLGREVAIKVLPETVASHPDRLARFEREAKTVAALNHPNIVILYSIEQAESTRFLTMELVEGQSLDQLVTPGGLPLARVLELAVPLADALMAAHQRGVVHRDLKPENVMVTQEGRLKVLDFGLAKVVGAMEPAWAGTLPPTVDARISITGQLIGTVPYMAPEQLRGESADARSDLFAFGVMLYELVTGRRPFGGATLAEVTSATLRDVPPPITRLRGDVPADLGRIVGRCLEKEPADRYQSALEVMNELRAMQRALERAGRIPALPVAPDVASVAVLPFVNRSHDEEDEYFADGLADELLNVLAKIRDLRVAARASSFQFKGKNADLEVIGRKLNVATLLDGSVRKAGNRVRIAVQLVNVADGFHLWSETYDRTLEDIFAVQDDIAQSVVKELRAKLLGEEPDSKVKGQVEAEVAAAAKGRGHDAEAHRLFLRGRYLVQRSANQDYVTGIDQLQRAVAIDPSHAQAWAMLSYAQSMRTTLGAWTPDEVKDLKRATAAGYVQAREAAERSLAMEPDLAEGHLAMGVVQWWIDRDWKGADASLRRAHELAPADAGVLRAAGLLAYTQGRKAEGMALCRRAVELDPLAVNSYTFLGRICRADGRLAEAEEAFRRATEISPEAVSAGVHLAFVLDEQGKGREALVELRKESAEWARLYGQAVIHRHLGRPEEADRALNELSATRADDSAFQIAVGHAVRGDADEAFRWLERAIEQRDSGLIFTKVEPLLRPLYSDPRWNLLMKKLRFEV